MDLPGFATEFFKVPSLLQTTADLCRPIQFCDMISRRGRHERFEEEGNRCVQQVYYEAGGC